MLNRFSYQARHLIILADTNHVNSSEAVAQELWNFYKISSFVILINGMLYAWLEYRCGEIHLQLMGKCASQRGLNLYPDVFPGDLHGCPVKVTPIETPPHLVTLDNQDKLAGIEVACVDYILKQLNVTLLYQDMATGM